MNSLALVLLAAALLVSSTARIPGLRLAAVTGLPQRGIRLGGRLGGVRPAGTRAWLAGAAGSLAAVVVGWPHGVVVGGGTAAAVWWLAGRRPGASRHVDPLGLAATWDLLAACLRSGLPVPTAVAAVVDDLPADAARALRATADLLALGADPVAAWTPAMACAHTAGLARGARRTARSGTALADVVSELAVTLRASASEAAEERAQRAGVLITAPLGLCFLPAFICLGIAPVVAGLARQLSN